MNDIKYIKGYREVSTIFGMVISKSKTVLIYDVGCYMPSPMVFYKPEWFDDCDEITEDEFLKLAHEHFEMILYEMSLLPPKETRR